ncbi:MAG: DNA polymerase III subunit delta [bacterium]|nr:DNA polymerase III subunit delta [bacterium]
MKPEQFLSKLKRQGPSPVYLFLGAEAYQRTRCRKALVEKVLGPEERESGLTRHDLDEISLAEAVDDARSLSLFAAERLIWVTSVESVLPRGRKKASQDEHSGPGLLEAYLKNPSPGVTVVLEASRNELQGEGKKKADRVQKLFAFIPEKVEFPPFSTAEAQALARNLASGSGIKIGPQEIALLVEAVAGDAGRIAVEVEKLRLFAGEGGSVTAEQIGELVPNARTATIFALVEALGRGDRPKALETLDALVRAGEYLPLALSFVGTQFRQALVAKEARLRGPQQIQGHFSKMGVPMWPSRARQVHQTLQAFSTTQLKNAVTKVHLADKALRDARPDDRTVMEELILTLAS